MPKISSSNYTDTNSGWKFSINDQELTGRPKFNPVKMNLAGEYRVCQHSNCDNKIYVTKRSGFCDNHSKHSHDLLLDLRDNGGKKIIIPSHTDIINHLMNWSKTRNYNLVPLFSAFSFNILGNIPDVSTLAGEITHSGFIPPKLQTLFEGVVDIVDNFFPDTNNSSYQPLPTSKGEIPARILAITFAGLVLCEEANRGDRWFWREIIKDEKRTEFLGGAMPIAYFAALSFPWGIEIGKAAARFVSTP